MDFIKLIFDLISPYLALAGVVIAYHATFGIPLSLLRSRAFMKRERLLRRKKRIEETGKVYPHAKAYFNSIMFVIFLIQFAQVMGLRKGSEELWSLAIPFAVFIAIFLTGYIILKKTLNEILAHEEHNKKAILPIMLDEVDEEIDIFLNPNRWERTTYSNGKWTYHRKPKRDDEQ